MGARPSLVNSLPQFIAGRQQSGARAMLQMLVLGASEAAPLTPVDTSNLLNSQYRSVEQDGTTIRGRVGYTADYASVVHDPEHKQTFRRAGAEKEFLTHGMERAEPNMRAVLIGAIRT